MTATAISNHHIVYILGAGFSAPRGLPVISEFMIALRDAHPWLMSHGRAVEAEAVAEVLGYRLRSAAAAYRVAIDLENIEELFSRADAGKDVLSKSVRIAIAATIDFKMSTTPFPTTSFRIRDDTQLPSAWKDLTSDGAEYRVPMYQYFLEALLGRWSDALATSVFVTFNYDCLVEEALIDLGWAVDYQLANNIGKLAGRDGSGDRSESISIQVLKMHGSINWMRQGTRTDRLRVVQTYRDVQVENAIPELIPPTWRKLLAKEVAPVWKSAITEIERATRLVIIGFSMPPTDLHFKYLLAAGLRQNVALREIVFVNPALQSVQDRATQLFGDLTRRPRIRIVAISIGGFVRQGLTDSTVSSIGRQIPETFERVEHSVY